MNASHRRPLFAYVLVTVAGAVVVAQGLVVSGLPIPFLRIDLDARASQDVVSRGQLLGQSAVEPREGAEGGDSERRLVIDDGTVAVLAATSPASTPAAPQPPASAAPQPDPRGDIRSDLVDGKSAGGPGDGSQGDGSGGGGDDPVFGGPPLTTPVGDGGSDAGDDAGDDGGEPADGPKPHDFDNGHGNDSHPYGPAQPPRGPGNDNGQGHGAGKDQPSKPDKPAQPSKDKPAKPAKDNPGTNKGHDKPAKEKPGKGLAKGKGKVKPGSKGKKHG